MGKRFGFPDTDEAVAELSLAEIESEISRSALGHKIGGSSLGRKSFFKPCLSALHPQGTGTTSAGFYVGLMQLIFEGSRDPGRRWKIA